MKVGDIVKLKPGFYVPRANNPCIGSEFETKGFIREHTSVTGVIVQWDNGTSNGYDAEGELELISLDYKSIW